MQNGLSWNSYFYWLRIIREETLSQSTASGFVELGLPADNGSDVLMAHGNRKNMPDEKKVMVLSVIHSYDSVEVLGIFDDIEKLRQECYKVIQAEDHLLQDISNLHIYECKLNHMFAEFYPFDYDKPNGRGWYFENQEDICGEILGNEFIQKLRMKQRKI